MLLRFGTGLDSTRSTRPGDATPVLGVRIVGERGLVEELEVRLGRAGRWPEDSERMLAYLAALRQSLVDGHSPDPFYRKAFESNPIAVSLDLLGRRDELVSAGVDFQAVTGDPNAPPRLQNLVHVEALLGTDSPVSRGRADRIAVLRKALIDGERPVSLESVSVVEPRILLEPGIATLLDLLPVAGVQVEYEEPVPAADVSTDLGTAQRVLAAALQSATVEPGADGVGETHSRPSNDGTLVIAEIESGRAGLEVYARTLHNPLPTGVNSCMVVPEGNWFLSQALRADGSPCSVGRDAGMPADATALLLLPVFLWKPLDPTRLVELLRSPASPLSPSLSRRLAHALEDEPGIGGTAWQTAVERAMEGVSQVDVRDRIKQRYDEFFDNGAFGSGRRMPQGQAVSADQAASIYRYCAGVYRARESAGEIDARDGAVLLSVLAERIAAAILAVFGGEHAGQAELDALVGEVIGDTVSIECDGEAGSKTVMERPVELPGQVDELLWLPAIRTSVLPADFWLSRERSWLRNLGAEPSAAFLASELDYYSAIRAVLSCRARCVFAVPALDGGEPAEEHSIVTAVEAILGSRMATPPVRKEFASVLSDNAVFESIPATALPARTTGWHLPEGVIALRDQPESPSSLEKLWKYPYQYVLSYLAEIRRSSLGELPSGPLLYGNIVHHAVEQFFSAHPWRIEQPPGHTELDAWLRDSYEQLLATVGLPLVQPGFSTERSVLRRAIARTVAMIITELNHRGTTDIQFEVIRSRSLRAMPIQGRIDILATGGPRPAVIDLKWGGRGNRETEISDGRDLQLSVYGWTACEDGPIDVDIAYFIVTSGLLLTHPDSTFATAVAPDAASPAGESVPALMSALGSTVQWRKKQFVSGIVELAPPEIDALHEIPTDILPRPSDPDPYDEYTTLLGWRVE
jgi:hypothetical protein